MRFVLTSLLAVALSITHLRADDSNFNDDAVNTARDTYTRKLEEADSDEARRDVAQAYIDALKKAQDTAREDGDIREVIRLETEIQRVTPLSPEDAVRKTPLADLRVYGGGFRVRSLEDHGKAFIKGDYTWRNLPEALVGRPYTQVRTGGYNARLIVQLREKGAVQVATSSPDKLLTDGWVKSGMTFGCNHHKFTEMVVLTRVFEKGQRIKLDQDGPSGTVVILPPKKK